MRIAVQPHDFELGGSQLNALDLAVAVRDRGHEVFLVSGDGPITELATQQGLRLLTLPGIGRRPSPSIARQLRRWAAEHSLDVIHGYEWPPAMEAWSATVGLSTVPVATVYSMDVAPFLPRSLDLIVGTEQIGVRATGARLGPAHVIEPPVNTRFNTPGTGGRALRECLGLGTDDLLITVVGRLVPQLKLEGILGAIRAMGLLPQDARATLLIVGDGSARDIVEQAAGELNGLGRGDLVRVVGEMRDPRAAYDAADITLGMGGSALRALAFGKPLIVQGERGFWRTLTPESYRDFAWAGWYGVAQGGDNSRALVRELQPLLDSAARRRQLGDYGLELVRRQFGLEAAARRLVDVYGQALDRPSRQIRHAPRSALGLASYKTRRKVARTLGRAPTDDFNNVSAISREHPPQGWVPPLATVGGVDPT